MNNKDKIGTFGGKAKLRQEDSTKRFTTDPEFIKEYADKLDLTFADAKFLIDEFVDSMRYLVDKNGAVTIRRFGTFYLHVTKRSKVFIPRTGEEVRVPLRYKIRFRPTNSFKNAINSKVQKNIKKAYEIKEEK